jgi:hypothetical protein
MRLMQRLWLGGPLLVRDLALGISGVVVGLVAFIGGCAFAGAGSFAWFAYWGLLGTASLYMGIQQLRRISDLPGRGDQAGRSVPSLPLAA